VRDNALGGQDSDLVSMLIACVGAGKLASDLGWRYIHFDIFVNGWVVK